MQSYSLGHRHYSRFVQRASSLDSVQRIVEGFTVDQPSTPPGYSAASERLWDLQRSAVGRARGDNRSMPYLHVYEGGDWCTGKGDNDDFPRGGIIVYSCLRDTASVVSGTISNESAAIVTVTEVSPCLYNITVAAQHFCSD